MTKSLNLDGNVRNDTKPSVVNSEDLRGISDSKPTICDQDGVQFIYGNFLSLRNSDISLKDREDIETTLIRASTIYLNKEIKEENSGKSYVDELRFSMSDRKCILYMPDYRFS